MTRNLELRLCANSFTSVAHWATTLSANNGELWCYSRKENWFENILLKLVFNMCVCILYKGVQRGDSSDAARKQQQACKKMADRRRYSVKSEPGKNNIAAQIASTMVLYIKMLLKY